MDDCDFKNILSFADYRTDKWNNVAEEQQLTGFTLSFNGKRGERKQNKNKGMKGKGQERLFG